MKHILTLEDITSDESVLEVSDSDFDAVSDLSATIASAERSIEAMMAVRDSLEQLFDQGPVSDSVMSLSKQALAYGLESREIADALINSNESSVLGNISSGIKAVITKIIKMIKAMAKAVGDVVRKMRSVLPFKKKQLEKKKKEIEDNQDVISETKPPAEMVEFKGGPLFDPGNGAVMWKSINEWMVICAKHAVKEAQYISSIPVDKYPGIFKGYAVNALIYQTNDFSTFENNRADAILKEKGYEPEHKGMTNELYNGLYFVYDKEIKGFHKSPFIPKLGSTFITKGNNFGVGKAPLLNYQELKNFVETNLLLLESSNDMVKYISDFEKKINRIDVNLILSHFEDEKQATEMATYIQKFLNCSLENMNNFLRMSQSIQSRVDNYTDACMAYYISGKGDINETDKS